MPTIALNIKYISSLFHSFQQSLEVAVITILNRDSGSLAQDHIAGKTIRQGSNTGLPKSEVYTEHRFYLQGVSIVIREAREMVNNMEECII